MTQNASAQEHQSVAQASSKQPVPAFKPVALPALAAAVRAAKPQPSSPAPCEPPAILRKEAMLG